MSTSASEPARLALCHEWLRSRHGSEKTFARMAEVFPEAELYALTLTPGLGLQFGGRAVHTSMLDRWGALRDQRALQLPLMPLAWRYSTRRRFDVVVTSSHACAKGFWPGREALHLCYCYTPMRYVWLATVDPRKKPNPLDEVARRILKRWDLASVAWVDEFAAISTAVQGRIESFYGRSAKVIHPPVDVDFYHPAAAESERFAVAVGRLVPYKRIDLAVRACAALGLPLVIAGSGPQEGPLRRLAAELGAEVSFVTSPADGQLRDLYRRAALCLFPAEEDFGIVAVEAQACGTPVVALGRGGSLDTVVDGETGVLMQEQSDGAMMAAITEALDAGFDPERCRTHSEQFSVPRFKERFAAWVREAAPERHVDLAG